MCGGKLLLGGLGGRRILCSVSLSRRSVRPSVCLSVTLNLVTPCLLSASAHAHASPAIPLPADESRDQTEQLLAAGTHTRAGRVIRERVGRRDEPRTSG